MMRATKHQFKDAIEKIAEEHHIIMFMFKANR